MQKKAKWIFMYWMPYNMNLWIYKEKIIAMLREGSEGEDIIIYVISDSKRQDYIQKTKILDGVIIEDITTEYQDSSNYKLFQKFLFDLLEEYDSRRWGLVFLGHGGRIDEISPDKEIGKETDESYSWMNIRDVQKVLLRFKEQLGKKIDFLFLQNCCKGTIEANYNFKDVASIIMSSQMKLGAPNYYYKDTFHYLAQNTDADGESVAKIIAEKEDKEMYISYTVISANAFDEFIKMINKLISKASEYSFEKDIVFSSYGYANEQLVDLVQFMKSISKKDDSYDEFIQFFHEKVLILHKRSANSFERDKCGLSMFLPSNVGEVNKYKDLDFYQEVEMEGFLEKIIGN